MSAYSHDWYGTLGEYLVKAAKGWTDRLHGFTRDGHRLSDHGLYLMKMELERLSSIVTVQEERRACPIEKPPA